MEKSARPRTALNECVKVVVRCRPLSQKEKNEGYEEVVRVWPERGAVQVYNPKGEDKLFTYDAAYDCSADTQTIYDEMVRPLVASVLDGFNGCVFAYGQTGTGKTHTMEGTPQEEGIIPRAFRHLWAHIETSASPDVTHLVSCSYVELYLEDVRDLLAKDCKKLTIRGQELNGFYIPEMTSVVCRSAEEMVRVMRAGSRQRAAGRTDMNEHSSRSHAVFLVTVETAHRTTKRIRVGKLNLVDLAGSERQRKTGASAERLREAARINQALSSLGNVISALAENSPHVPYRYVSMPATRTTHAQQTPTTRPRHESFYSVSHIHPARHSTNTSILNSVCSFDNLFSCTQTSIFTFILRLHVRVVRLEPGRGRSGPESFHCQYTYIRVYISSYLTVFSRM
ncbi:PREDICTED: kinesin-like protein Klp68D isoform X2 [Papilio polytes]|uniref:kinesin-like protein Klp68D isoform X2 n=1 Tax=Papilio polytes TaxID=76194 RepID=UPI000675C29C|nr:PREDICTED: kinesin-like protein Klp68D isoform X2 [Papilio polytes]